MRERDRDYGRLEDIIMASNNIMTFTEGHTEEELSVDKLRYFAVVKNVEIIGEAAYMLTPEFKEAHQDIPWDDIIKMRHILVHGYATILPELLWHTALIDVPELKKRIDNLLLEEKEKKIAALRSAIEEGEASGYVEEFDAEAFLKEIKARKNSQ
jgi:uncharacterized protein with HEPN domain